MLFARAGKLRRAEQQQDDGEDDQQVPAFEGCHMRSPSCRGEGGLSLTPGHPPRAVRRARRSAVLRESGLGPLGRGAARRRRLEDLDVAAEARREAAQAELVRHAHRRDRLRRPWTRRRRGRGSRRAAARRIPGSGCARRRRRHPASNQPGTGSSPCVIGMSVSSQVAHAIEVERAHRLAQVAPSLQVPLAVGDVHLDRVDRAGRGRGIRRLVGERRRRRAAAARRRRDRGPRRRVPARRSPRRACSTRRGRASRAGRRRARCRRRPGMVRASCRPVEQRRRLARGELGRSLEADRVGDDDDVALVEQLPVDVEQVVRHLPVAAVAGEPDHGELLDHRAHLRRG